MRCGAIPSRRLAVSTNEAAINAENEQTQRANEVSSARLSSSSLLLSLLFTRVSAQLLFLIISLGSATLPLSNSTSANAIKDYSKKKEEKHENEYLKQKDSVLYHLQCVFRRLQRRFSDRRKAQRSQMNGAGVERAAVFRVVYLK